MAALRTHEDNLMRRHPQRNQGVGNGHHWHDVATRAATGDDNGARHVLGPPEEVLCHRTKRDSPATSDTLIGCDVREQPDE